MMAGHSIMNLIGLPSRRDIEEAREKQEAEQQRALEAGRRFAKAFSEVAEVIRLRGGHVDRQRDGD